MPGDSVEVILQKEESSDLKVYDMDYLMDAGGQTKDNFYGSLDREGGINVTNITKKKKKKRVVNKKKKVIIPDNDQF